MKKPEIVSKIVELKDKVAVGDEIKSPRTRIKDLTDTVNHLLSNHESLNSDLTSWKTMW